MRWKVLIKLISLEIIAIRSGHWLVIFCILLLLAQLAEPLVALHLFFHIYLHMMILNVTDISSKLWFCGQGYTYQCRVTNNVMSANRSSHLWHQFFSGCLSTSQTAQKVMKLRLRYYFMRSHNTFRRVDTHFNLLAGRQLIEWGCVIVSSLEISIIYYSLAH